MTAITRDTPTHTRVSLPHAIKDTLVITRRNLLRNVRLPQLLIFATVQPVMFLLLTKVMYRFIPVRSQEESPSRPVAAHGRVQA